MQLKLKNSAESLKKNQSWGTLRNSYFPVLFSESYLYSDHLDHKTVKCMYIYTCTLHDFGESMKRLGIVDYKKYFRFSKTSNVTKN